MQQSGTENMVQTSPVLSQMPQLQSVNKTARSKKAAQPHLGQSLLLRRMFAAMLPRMRVAEFRPRLNGY